MKIAIRNVLGLCVLGIMGASAGCAAADPTDGTGAGKGATGDTAVAADGQPADKALPAKDALPAQEGLTIVKSDPQWGLKAVFKDADRALLIERRVGLPRHADKLAENPKLGPFEDDMLVTNEAGQVIMIQQGGDQLVDPTWNDRFNETVKQPLDVAKRTAELALLDRATQQLLTRPEALDVGARASFDGMRLLAQRPLESYRTLEADGMSYGPGYNQLGIYVQPIVPTGSHSATWANINGSSRVTCNHGDCASWSSMSNSSMCGGMVWNADTRYCSTAYQFDSYGNHNCHDDTVLQLWSFKYGPQDTWGGVCNNYVSHVWAPSGCYVTSW
jgi:hypothetical protein